MFTNLVRIQLIKISHSKFFRWSVAASLLVAAIIYLVIVFWAVDQMDYAKLFKQFDFLKSDVTIYWTALSMNLLSTIGNVVLMGTTISLICNHYENREKINVAGVVRSPYKWFMAELVGIVILIAGTAAVVMALAFTVGPAAGYPWPEVYKSPNRMLLIFVAIMIAAFIDSAPAIYVSKFTRNKPVAIVVSISLYVVRMLVLSFVGGFLTALVNKGAEESVMSITSIINPGTGLLGGLVDGEYGMNTTTLCFYTIIRIGLIVGLGFIATRRKDEL